MMPPRGGIVNYPIKDNQTLYASYMPFVQNGALFIPSTRQVQLGDEVFAVIQLPDAAERLPLSGKVVWVSHRSQGSRPAGFAVQLAGEEGRRLREEIEQRLRGVMDQEQPTYTM